jgi:hypothetical protein
MQGGALFDNVSLNKLHQSRNFEAGSRPVFDRKGVKAYMLHAKVVSIAHYRFNPSGAFLMTFYAAFALPFSPAAIAVHNNSNMSWNVIFVEPAFKLCLNLLAIHLLDLFLFTWNNSVYRADFGAFAAVGALVGNNIRKACFYCLKLAD